MKLTVEAATQEKVFYIDLDIIISKDGIGYYEFWGSTGFDHGKTYVSDYTIKKITVDNLEIHQCKISDEDWVEINEQIEKKLENIDKILKDEMGDNL